MRFAHALQWSFLSELASKGIQPVVFVILASLLSPADFGVMAAALMVIALSQVFWDAGMGKAVIQRQDRVEEAANAAFWINIGLGVLTALILYFAAGFIADKIFHDGRVTDVIKVMTLHVVLGSISAVHVALLQKELHFKRLFWVRFVTTSLPGVISIPFALQGYGYWALVIGVIAGQLAQLLLLWRISKWRPQWSFEFTVAREIGGFGTWVVMSGLLTWFYIWTDSLVVGVFLGSDEMGMYRTGSQFTIMLFALFFSPAVPVLYSQLSRIDHSKEHLRNTADKIIGVMTIIAIPGAIVIYSLSESMASSIFGTQWQGIGFVIGVMALMHGISWVVGMNGEIYRAIGKPAIESLVTGATLVFYIAGYLFSIKHGLEAFIWTRLGLAVGATLLHLIVLQRLLSINLAKALGRLLLMFIAVSIVVYVIKFSFSGVEMTSMWRLLIEGSITAVSVALLVYLLERQHLVKDLLNLIAKRATDQNLPLK
jgi:PST family polysaccharide transporter